MIDTLLRLSLPALRAITALARGAKSDNDLRGAGVSRSCVAGAMRELHDLGLVSTRPGRCAELGVRGIAAIHELEVQDGSMMLDIRSMTLAQARVYIAQKNKTYESTRALAQECNLSELSVRDALRYFAGHPGNLQSAPASFEAHRETAPREITRHTATDDSSLSKKEQKAVLNSEIQQTAVVVNFSIYQKLLENGLANDVAAQLIAQDESECELQITRLEKLKNMPVNRAGYLRKAIALKYRDFDNKKNEPTPPKKVEEFPFERRTDACKPPEGMLESLKILLGGAA